MRIGFNLENENLKCKRHVHQLFIPSKWNLKGILTDDAETDLIKDLL